MSIEDTKAKIAVMQEFAGGAKIQCQSRSARDDWDEVDPPSWDWINFDYRVAPPKPRERWHIFGSSGSHYGSTSDESAARSTAATIEGTYAKFVEVL